jgi:hypothetical protein
MCKVERKGLEMKIIDPKISKKFHFSKRKMRANEKQPTERETENFLNFSKPHHNLLRLRNHA